jgi:RNA polymerase sigma-70 factor (ECF subfamily)
MDDPAQQEAAAEDARLLAAYAAGDGTAARALAARHLPRVLSHAARLLGDRAEAEDVAQEAMLRLWRIAREWRAGEARVGTWLYRVTANLCTDRLRRRARHGLVDLDAVPAEPVDPAPGAPDALQRAARAQALQAALDALPLRQRQAVALRHLEGLGLSEIAAIMDISAEAAESLVARGKRALAARLAGRRDALGFEDD